MPMMRRPAESLERLTSSGLVEYVIVSPADVPRHRLRLVTNAGTECLVGSAEGRTPVGWSRFAA